MDAVSTQDNPAHIFLGGSFDPVHNAHLFMAKRIHDQLNELNAEHRIHLLPTAGSPLKNTQTTTSDRLAMLKLAVNDAPFANLSIDTRETTMSPPVYTIDTLTELRAELGGDAPIIFVMGLDSLRDLAKWKRGGELLDFCHFWLFKRTLDSDLDDDLSDDLPENITKYVENLPFNLKNSLTSSINTLLTCSNGYIFLDESKPPSISSTKVRALVARHKSDAKDLLNLSVWEYIKTNGLYRLNHRKPNRL